MSTVDSVYRGMLLSKFFTKGWGDPNTMRKVLDFRKIISNRDACHKLVSYDHPIYIDKIVERKSTYTIYEGHFMSPMVSYLPDLLPNELKVAKFQMILPRNWKHSSLKPVCLHLAGTGDHYFWRRRISMAKPLLKEAGIASIILENPFYGLRKPSYQRRSSLNNVSDIFIMGGCLILESLALFHFCERLGFGPLCVTGISMGGHMACLAGSSWHKPISIVPCLSWTTASCVFTQGVMSGAIPWDVLENQYNSYGDEFRQEIQRMIKLPENNKAFSAGIEFAKEYPESLKNFSDIFSIKAANNVNKNIDTLNFMRGIMDECTHLGNFSIPIDTELVIIISASRDGYVPRDGLLPLTTLWKGSHQRLIDTGHVTAILFNMDIFRKAIKDSLNKHAQKYYQTNLF